SSQRIATSRKISVAVELEINKYSEQVRKKKIFYDIPTPADVVKSFDELSQNKIAYDQFAQRHPHFIKHGNLSLSINLLNDGRPSFFTIFERNMNNQAEMKEQMEKLIKQIVNKKIKHPYDPFVLEQGITLFRQEKIKIDDFFKKFPELSPYVEFYDYIPLLKCSIRL
ncbi:MAG: hypothetical protein WCG27_11685, partial [Pseudomonadota bacterium]